jgi:mannose-6-phosphate isomerase-like protein (cupin superfamily)
LNESDEPKQFREDVMMTKMFLLAASIALALPAQAQERQVPTKLFASASEVEAALAKSRAEHKPGNNVTVLASVGPYPAQLEYRIPGSPPSASVHKAQAEFIYIIAGGCTLITGGTLVDPKDNGANMGGTGIAGGTPRKVAKGDYIMVPPNTPHQYSDIQGELAMVTLHMPMAPGK